MLQQPSALHLITPLSAEIEAVIDAIDLTEVREVLGTESGGRGRPPYDACAMFGAFVASFVMRSPSTSALARTLEDNVSVAAACGFEPGSVPSRPTLGRYFRLLALNPEIIERAFAGVTDELKRLLPGFGEVIAIDSTTVRTHSNPDRDPPTDADAGWSVKSWVRKGNKRLYSYGFKANLAVDATFELPIALTVTPGNRADSLELEPVLRKAADAHDWFAPKIVTADKGYDATHIYETITDQFDAIPVIPIRAMPAGSKSRKPGTEARTNPPLDRDSVEWKAYYDMRTSVERVYGRLKETRRLEAHCFRGLMMIRAHVLMAVMVLQAKALAQCRAGADLRECLRKVA